MAEIINDETVGFVTPMSKRDLVLVIVTGLVAGFVSWGIHALLVRFLVPQICTGTAGNYCVVAPGVIEWVGLVVGAIVALVGLIRLRVFRPLLIILAVTLSLAGALGQSSGFVWYWAILSDMLLFGFVYGLFAWTVGIRNFWLAVALVAVLGIATHLILLG